MPPRSCGGRALASPSPARASRWKAASRTFAAKADSGPSSIPTRWPTSTPSERIRPSTGRTASTTAAGIPRMALEHGADLYIVNAEPTPFDDLAAVVLHGNAGVILPQVVRHVAAS